jgi:O-antigen/teichoic acid export membrane protein
LTKKEIRLQYSGFIVFAAKMLSVASGLIFQLMIARGVRLYSVDWEFEYDLWFNLTDILAYFTLLAAAFPFWTMRFVARGKEEAVKTGIVGNLIISAIATAIYLPLVPFITSSLGIPQEYLLLYFLISVQIIELYSINALEACLRAKIPHTIGYGLLVAEACKVGLGYLLIWEFKQPLLGALLSLIIAFTVQISYYSKLLGGELKTRVKWEYMKEWIKGSTANIYNVVGNRIATFIFMMLFIYGGHGALSRYGLAAQIANVVAYSSFLAFALYPKLLAEKNRDDITTSLKMVLMFAIPMTAGAIALSDSYMIIMQSEYRDASLVLTVLAIDAFVMTVSTLFAAVLYGTESVDERTKISFRELIKSRLFIAFSLPYFHSAITLPTTFFVLTNYAQDQPLPSAIYVSIINASARLAMFLVLYAIVRKTVIINIPWKNIAKYVFASAVMATVLFIIPHPTRIYLTLIATAIGGITYLALLMAIDKEARLLVHSIWQEIKFKIEGIIT